MTVVAEMVLSLRPSASLVPRASSRRRTCRLSRVGRVSGYAVISWLGLAGPAGIAPADARAVQHRRLVANPQKTGNYRLV